MASPLARRIGARVGSEASMRVEGTPGAAARQSKREKRLVIDQVVGVSRFDGPVERCDSGKRESWLGKGHSDRIHSEGGGKR